jgi:hypothetical protein
MFVVCQVDAAPSSPAKPDAKCNDCPTTPHPPVLTEEQAQNKTQERIILDLGGGILIQINNVFCNVWADGAWGCEAEVIFGGLLWNAGCLWNTRPEDGEEGCTYGLGFAPAAPSSLADPQACREGPDGPICSGNKFDQAQHVNDTEARLRSSHPDYTDDTADVRGCDLIWRDPGGVGDLYSCGWHVFGPFGIRVNWSCEYSVNDVGTETFQGCSLSATSGARNPP